MTSTASATANTNAMATPQSRPPSDRDLFEYTSGRWLYNDALRHAERRRIFNVGELKRLAAESVNRSPDDIVAFEKLAEGGFNRTFLVTMRHGFQMIARIPYPVTEPKHFAIASEAATLTFLRSAGLPVPDVYSYSPTPDNPSQTEYIFMEFVKGANLSDTWFDLDETQVASLTRQLAQLEFKMMSLAFPAGGSLYFANDLANSPTGSGVPLHHEKRFCVGPDADLGLWYSHRSQLDVNREPYANAETALTRGAEKELAYLQQFGRPLLPFQRIRRDAYIYQKQSPLDHIKNLNRYLAMASSLVPQDPALSSFCIRHPDLQPNNIIVSLSPGSGVEIAGLIDWQHASILPLFLQAGIPGSFQCHDDPISRSRVQPSLPNEWDKLDDNQKSKEMEIYRRRLLHYHYIENAERYNKPHYLGLTDAAGSLRRRLFQTAREPWEGETMALKAALVQATENWETLVGPGPRSGATACPIKFDPEDISKTLELQSQLTESDSSLKACREMIGFGSDGWVPNAHFEQAMAQAKKLKEDCIAAAETDEERTQILENWLLDDMDEEEYL